jgi:Domain of unknown function (DUF4397)
MGDDKRVAQQHRRSRAPWGGHWLPENEAAMKVFANRPRLRSLLAALALSVGLTGLLVPAASATAASAAGTKSMSGMDGWMRLAHLSPSTPAVDVYLYSVGDPRATLVLHHVAYGTVSSYMKIAPGEYTVAMRAAGAATGSPPVLSTTVHVVADGAYTVAGMGTASSLRLQVLRDRLTTPKGKILIRVIQASLRQHRVTVTAGREVLARNLAFGQLTSYRVANPGTWTFRAIGSSERTSQAIQLTPNCIHTIVILDDPGHLKIDDLLDAAGSMVMPMGSVPTGLGGTATRPSSPAQPWLLTMVAGGLLALAGGIAIRRTRQRPEQAR